MDRDEWLKVMDVVLIILLVLLLYDVATFNGKNFRRVTSAAKEKVADLTHEYTKGDVPWIPTGGGNTVKYNIGPIINIKTCSSEPDKYGTCNETSQFEFNDSVYVYWQVDGGVGCCNTYECNFQEFNQTCLGHDQNLMYKAFINDKLFISSVYNYTCEMITPWNFINFRANKTGETKILVYQRACGPKTIGVFERFVNVTG